MNFVSLVTHGLSAISVFGERVGVRVLVALSFLILAFLPVSRIWRSRMRVPRGWRRIWSQVFLPKIA